MSGDLNILALMLEAGIIVQLVVLLLVLFSVLSWAIAFSKYKEVKNVEKENKKFLSNFQSLSSFNHVPELLNGEGNSFFGVILHHCYREYALIQDAKGAENLESYFSRFGFSTIERASFSAVSSGVIKLKANLNYLASIGSIAPFVGLFGTVIGIINSFQGLAEGGGSLQAVAPGIAEALVATAIGLAAAIPAVWFYNQLSIRVGKIQTEMENFSQDLINLVERSV